MTKKIDSIFLNFDKSILLLKFYGFWQNNSAFGGKKLKFRFPERQLVPLVAKIRKSIQIDFLCRKINLNRFEKKIDF